MKEFVEAIDEFAKKIVELESKRKKIGNILREINSSTTLDLNNEILETKIISQVDKTKLENLKIAGIDGGLVKTSLHGIDLMLLRAVGVIFYYSDGKLSQVEYYPDSIPSPQPIVTHDPFSDLEFEFNSNYERMIIEVDTAREVVEKFEPDILLLNGSVIPHYTWPPEKNSLLYSSYQRMIEVYKNLFDTIKKKKTILAGVIEDSRGTRFCEIIESIIRHVSQIDSEAKPILEKTKDTNLLSYALQFSERSFVFPYSSDVTIHPILKEFGDVAKQIFTFYVKVAEFDRPIRVDFLGDKGIIEIAQKLSSVLLVLCGHSGYSMPSVLIEADQRAKLSEKDLDMFYMDLINKTGNLPGLFEQRRNLRPF